MKWDDKYLIGIKDIDNQHKKLVEIICKFKDSLSDKTLNIVDEMGHIIKFLVSYANYHFEAEEAFMERISYPDLELHKRIHSELITKLKEVLVKLKSKQSYTPIEFYYFLMKWLTEHIEGEDDKIGKFYKKSVKISQSTKTKLLVDSGYVLSVFEPNLNKLKLLRKNNLVTIEDENKKKLDFILRFYNQYADKSLGIIVQKLKSVAILFERELITKEELNCSMQNIVNKTDINELLNTDDDVKHNLADLEYLNENNLITADLYSDVKLRVEV
ncbi:MAG: bacteriohemerythrin [Spirochaetaceae bacterium]